MKQFFTIFGVFLVFSFQAFAQHTGGSFGGSRWGSGGTASGSSSGHSQGTLGRSGPGWSGSSSERTSTRRRSSSSGFSHDDDDSDDNNSIFNLIDLLWSSHDRNSEAEANSRAAAEQAEIDLIRREAREEAIRELRRDQEMFSAQLAEERELQEVLSERNYVYMPRYNICRRIHRDNWEASNLCLQAVRSSRLSPRSIMACDRLNYAGNLNRCLAAAGSILFQQNFLRECEVVIRGALDESTYVTCLESHIMHAPPALGSTGETQPYQSGSAVSAQ